jgi:arylsulfatase A-like enzyme
MPSSEAFAQQGTRFTRFYTESTCSASRVALLTGQYAARNGFMPVARGISPDVLTLPEFMRAQGYATHLVGKWHAGEINPEAFPQQQGFDTSFGFLSQWMLKGTDAKGAPQLKAPTYLNPWLVDEHNHYQHYSGHLEDILTAHTIGLIKQPHGSQPWFIYHAFYLPHTPLEPAERFAKKFPATKEGKYRAMLTQLDDSVAQVFAALKDSGQWDNTIVIFASDNGSPEKNGSLEQSGSPEKNASAEESGNSNAPFSGKKAEYEEGGIRTPLLIKWQRDAHHPATRTDVVSIMDIFPSLAAMIAPGQTQPVLDGVASLLPEQPVMRRDPLFFLSYGSLSVLSADGKTRLIREWNAEQFTATELWHYDDKALPHSVLTTNDEALFDTALRWRDTLRALPLVQDAQRVQGRDFLRAPLNPSWSLAFAFRANDDQKHQQLLLQKNLLDVSLQHNTLTASVNGITATTGNIKAGQCYRVVLSGEFYDRFSSIQGKTRPSHLYLVLNGKETASSEAVLDSFEHAAIDEPTYFGVNPDDAALDFSGSVSAPLYFSSQLLPNDKPVPSHFDEALAGLSCNP